MAIEVEAARAGERELPVGRDDRHAAAGPVFRDHGGHQAGRLPVERDRRLVEKPERRRRRGEARQGEAPPLAGGEEARRHLGQRLQAEPGEGVAGGPRGSLDPGPEIQVLRRRERRFHRVEMAHIVEPAAMGGPVRAQRRAVPGERAARGCQQAGHDAEQARLARAVDAGEDQRAAAFEGEAHVGEDRPPAADAGHAAGFEAGRARRAVHRTRNLAPSAGRA